MAMAANPTATAGFQNGRRCLAGAALRDASADTGLITAGMMILLDWVALVKFLDVPI
jgi:hypothetical protein